MCVCSIGVFVSHAVLMLIKKGQNVFLTLFFLSISIYEGSEPFFLAYPSMLLRLDKEALKNTDLKLK